MRRSKWKKRQRRGRPYWQLTATDGVYDLYVWDDVWYLQDERGRGLPSFQEEDFLPATASVQEAQVWANQTIDDHATSELYAAMEFFFNSQWQAGNEELWHVWGSALDNAAETAGEHNWLQGSIQEAEIAIATAFDNDTFELPLPAEFIKMYRERD